MQGVDHSAALKTDEEWMLWSGRSVKEKLQWCMQSQLLLPQTSKGTNYAPITPLSLFPDGLDADITFSLVELISNETKPETQKTLPLAQEPIFESVASLIFLHFAHLCPNLACVSFPF